MDVLRWHVDTQLVTRLMVRKVVCVDVLHVALHVDRVRLQSLRRSQRRMTR
jgi:hypothetical protein